VISQLTGAFVRAILVMVLIATPSLMLPGVSHDTTQIVALVALFAAALTFFEYARPIPAWSSSATRRPSTGCASSRSSPRS